jgi:hypothetical protein
VPDAVPLPGLVRTVNVVVDDPAGTVTLSGTASGSVADTVTFAPPAGAAAVRLIVAVTLAPPTTLDALNAMEARAAWRVTVTIGDCLLLPLNPTVIAAVPADTPVTVKLAVDEPPAIIMDDGTAATEGLLLESVTFAPAAGAAAVRLTVPCVLAPTDRLVEFSATLETVTMVVGVVGELDPPHPAIDATATAVEREQIAMAAPWEPMSE